MVEGGIGWIAALLNHMDHFWRDHHRWVEPKLDEPPSVYFQRQFWATFEDDRAGILTRDLIGVDRLLWGADYPHTEGVWPRSREQIAKDFVGVPEADVHKMVVDNAARLYNLA
jgi:predicted TIM-barrel fold metal-dependent hydrolase